MIYSVWNPDNQVYRYYQVGEAHNDDGPTPKPQGGCALGYSPEEISWKLPANATAAGSGEAPKGVVVHPQGAYGSLGDFDSKSTLLTLAATGVLLWYITK